MTKQDAEYPDLTLISVRVPAPLLEEALAIGKAMGMRPGDLHRDLWIAGLREIAESYNKILVNKSLRKKYINSD